jgi:hypothetical protein
MKLRIRLRQLPVETLDPGQKTLVMGTTLPKVAGQASFMQGPCVLEINMGASGEDIWVPVEFTQ